MKKHIVNFHYSRPYESSLAALSKTELKKDHSLKMEQLVELVQNVWSEHESKILELFKDMYKIKIEEHQIKAWISLVAHNSYSDPLTISLRRYPDVLDNKKTQRLVIYEIIHELAHYFAYTRPEDSYFDTIYRQIRDQKISEDKGVNLHFLIQAVEFGIGAEIFGVESAFKRREFISQSQDSEYGISAKLLIDLNVPLNKTCLEFIEKGVVS